MSPANLHTGRLPVLTLPPDGEASGCPPLDADQPESPSGATRRGGTPDAGVRLGRWRRATRWVLHRGQYLTVAACVLAALVLLGLRLPSAAGSFGSAWRHVTASRLGWLLLALVTEALSFVAYGLAQRRLVSVCGRPPKIKTVTLLVFACSGLTSLLPGGMLPASGWLIDQYCKRGVDQRIALWAVIAGGFTATVSAFALLLIGCAVASIGPTWLLAMSGAILVTGSAGFVVAGHRLDRVEVALGRHGHRGPLYRWVHRLAASGADLGGCRIGVVGGIEVFAYSTANWVLDAVCLLTAFHAVGFAIPARSFLFAYTASQALGSVIPLPGGVGVVDGGLVGALTLTGTPVGHAIVGVIAFRLVSYWLVTAAATLTMAVLSHRWRNLRLGTGESAASAAALRPASGR